ncbi:MAG TPA: TonB-dependent siderophore myxochelin receptor MxcH [Polyangiaceae bacterium]|nr:TonB-dependent siderophore myxochelin receptor MxcH [Polyangiaceae bacterium]
MLPATPFPCFFGRRGAVVGGLLLVAQGLVGGSAVARTERPEAQSEAPGAGEQHAVLPPKLLEAPEPEFPEQARAAGLTGAEVVLRLTIDAEGAVTTAEVTQPAGSGFDEAATLAALGYRFEPARRGDVAVAARILINVVFRLPDAATSAAPTEPPPAAAPPPPRSPADAHPSAPTTAAPSPAPSTSPTARVPLEITVLGQAEAERARRSAEAVHVVETQQAKRQTADLGEVLARAQGVGVQRSGGLGSDTRFSLNGLTDDQVRFFLDGVPLDFAGYPFGVANVPVNLVERVEIYRGVVPVRFGADALGGAVNLVSDRDIGGTHGSLSFQAGSFGIHRTTLSARHLDEPSGWFTRVNAFVDRAANDYPMDIQVPDARGHEVPARVYRFHDAYAAEGANVETGIVNEPWARRLLLRGFVTRYDKEVQHNLMMTFNPYGDVTLAESAAGASLRYENTFARRVIVKAVGGYAHTAQVYRDLGECVYDWFGQCLRQRPQAGERRGRAEDQLYWEHAGFARLSADWRVWPGHTLTVSSALSIITRSGDERRQANPQARDALSAERRLTTLVSGVEYTVELLQDRLENALFGKEYLQVLRAEDPLASGLFRRRDHTTHRFGVGDSLRYTFANWIYAKASYEWATRLPTPDELFGNAFPVKPNLQLEPELSHNLNLGVTLSGEVASIGQLRADVNGFLRNAERLIVLVGDDEAATYRNVYSARSRGVELAAGWTSPGQYLALDGNVTWVDFRNTSSEGAFAANQGDRIPNRPYLFGTGSVRLQKRELSTANDELSLTWTSRYVHEFFRGWEGLGTHKLTVPAQLVHGVALTYLVRGQPTELSFTGEAQNVTNAAAFDVFGVPRPGRAIFFKATASL